MILSLKVENFTSIKDSGLLELSNYNVFIGKNASGKSNFFLVLDLVRKLARGSDINECFSSDALSHKNLFFEGNQNTPIHIDVSFLDSHNDTYRLIFKIQLIENEKTADSLAIFFESLNKLEEGQWSNIYLREKNRVKYLGKNELPIKVNTNKLLLSYYNDERLIAPAKRLKTIFIINHTDIKSNIDPIINASKPNLAEINHLAVALFRKSPSDFNKAAKCLNKIIPYLNKIDIIDLSSLVSTKKEKTEDLFLVNWKQKTLDLVLSSSSLSSGDKRIIYITLALFYLEGGSTVIIEEIENGIHLGRINTFIDQIRTQADNRDIQIMISTHSREILNNILPKDVIFCKLVPGKGTEYKHMTDTEAYKEISQDLASNSSARDYLDTGFFQ